MQNSRPQLLFVSPCTPDKQGVGWEQRAFSTLLAYSKYMDIHLWFTPTFDNPNLQRANKLKIICKSVTAFDKNTFLNRPFALQKFNELIKQSDCVHVFRQFGLMNIQHKCIFWDMDELPLELRDKSKNPNARNISFERYNKVLALYSDACKVKKCIFTSSFLEVNSYLGRIDYLPNIYSSEINFYKKNPSNELIFVGNTNFKPNMDAICYFSKKILPLLPPSFKFTIVGRGPRKAELKEMFNELAKNNNTNFLFDVDSCAPLYKQAALAVVPLNYGGGTKLKILEAFGNFCPVVSTSKGCEGINVIDGQNILIRDRPEDFAVACKELIENTLYAETIAKNAYKLLVAEYSQNVVDELLFYKLKEFNII